MFSFLTRLGLFGALLVVFLELVFRTVVPAAEMPAGFQDQEYGVMGLDVSQRKDGHNSIGRLGRPRFAWHVNNYGFNSPYDYKGPDERDVPCIVIIGNSYVQGLYSDADEHLSALLNQMLGGSAEVYNLASSGLPLSQAPRVVEFARDRFSPDLIIVQAGSGSVHGSLHNNGAVANCQQYLWADGELKAVPPSRFKINQRNRKIRMSAMVRYLYYNSNLNLGGQGQVVQAVQRQQDPGSRPAAGDLPAPGLVMDRVMTDIRNLVPNTPVLFVFDADRNLLYESDARPPRLKNSPVLEESALEHGYRFLDLTDAFWSEYSHSHRLFNFPDNYHWNPYGVRIVARAVLDELESIGLVEGGRFIGTSPDAGIAR